MLLLTAWLILSAVGAVSRLAASIPPPKDRWFLNICGNADPQPPWFRQLNHKYDVWINRVAPDDLTNPAYAPLQPYLVSGETFYVANVHLLDVVDAEKTPVYFYLFADSESGFKKVAAFHIVHGKAKKIPF